MNGNVGEWEGQFIHVQYSNVNVTLSGILLVNGVYSTVVRFSHVPFGHCQLNANHTSLFNVIRLKLY